MDGKAERRWRGTSPCDNERTSALRKNAPRAYEGKSAELISPGPWSRVGAIQLNWVGSAHCPNVTYVLLGGRKALCCCCWCGTPAKGMGDSTTAGGGRVQGAGGVRPACWGSQTGGGRAGGRLKPDVKVTIGGDRQPRLGGDVVTFDDMREFPVASLKYEQQIHVANEDGGDRVLARRRELVDSAAHMMVDDEFYDGSSGSISPSRSYRKGSKRLLELMCSRRVV